MVRRIFSIGFPAALQQAITSFSNVFVQSYVNFFGSACMAGWSVYNKIDLFLPSLKDTNMFGRQKGTAYIITYGDTE